MPLYTSLEPDNENTIVFERCLSQTVTITMRPLSLPGDWRVISKWLQYAFGRRSATVTHLPKQYLRETLSTMLQCDFAQPFVGLINDQPAFLVEICDGDKQCDALDGGTHVFEPGDHAIRLFCSQPVIHTRYWPSYALFSSLDYFFTHQQVRRIVWQLHEKDRFNIQLANQLGFASHKIKPSLKPVIDERSGIRVFLYLRENFKSFSSHHHLHMQKLL